MSTAHDPKPNTEKTLADFKGKRGFMRIIKALGYSWDGIKAANEEPGFKDLILVHVTLMIVLIFVSFSLETKMILVFASAFSMICELFNTAIEAAVDHTSTDIHPLAKRAKDVGSAAQYSSLTLTAILWIMAIYHAWKG